MATDIEIIENMKNYYDGTRNGETYGEIVSHLISSITSDTAYSITKDEFIELLDLAIDEYNKVADVKITDATSFSLDGQVINL